MPSLYPSSTCATHGSAESTSHGSNASKSCGTPKHSTSKHKKSSEESSSSLEPRALTLLSADYHDSSTSRTAAYVKDQIDSQIPHRHPSIQGTAQDHTSRTSAALDAFDTAMKK